MAAQQQVRNALRNAQADRRLDPYTDGARAETLRLMSRIDGDALDMEGNRVGGFSGFLSNIHSAGSADARQRGDLLAVLREASVPLGAPTIEGVADDMLTRAQAIVGPAGGPPSPLPFDELPALPTLNLSQRRQQLSNLLLNVSLAVHSLALTRARIGRALVLSRLMATAGV